MRILVVDDELLLREGLARLLLEMGFHVVATAATPGDALREAREHRPDVVITDIRMPPNHEDEGLRLAAKLAEELPHVGVLVLSQHLESSYALRLLQVRRHRVGYLLKTRVGDLAVLRDAVERVAAGGAVVDPKVVEAVLARTTNSKAAGSSRPETMRYVPRPTCSSGTARRSIAAAEEPSRTDVEDLQRPSDGCCSRLDCRSAVQRR